MVSFVSHAPFAKAKKSVHAFAVLSTYEGSNTLSAGRFARLEDCAAAGIAAKAISAVRSSGDFRMDVVVEEWCGVAACPQIVTSAPGWCQNQLPDIPTVGDP
jgi:hypothetical protein